MAGFSGRETADHPYGPTPEEKAAELEVCKALARKALSFTTPVGTPEQVERVYRERVAAIEGMPAPGKGRK